MAGGIGNIELKVNTEIMVSQANEVKKLVGNMEKRFKEIETQVERTKKYWIGKAGDVHRKMYEDKKEDIATMLTRLKEHPDDLLAVAGNYQSAEKYNVDLAANLPVNILD